MSAFLNGKAGGLILIERDGYVALCSTEARRVLALKEAIVGRPLRHLLKTLSRGKADERRVAMMQMRKLLHRGEPLTLDLSIAGASVLLDVTSLGEAGWSVRVESAAARDARLGASVAGTIDPLTGLPNRARFGMQLDEARARLDRRGEGFAVLAVDLDRFKHINDTLRPSNR